MRRQHSGTQGPGVHRRHEFGALGTDRLHTRGISEKLGDDNR